MNQGLEHSRTAALRERLVQVLAGLGLSRPGGEGDDDFHQAVACIGAIDSELARIRADRQRLDRRIAELSEVIEGIVAFDYSRRAAFSGAGDALDGFAVCLNVLAEELGNSMVSKAYVHNIIESMTDALLVLEKNGNIKIANAAAARLSGYTKEELVGRPIDALFPEIRASDVVAHTTVVHEELSCLTKAQATVVVSFSASRMSNRRGDIEGIVCVGRDLTEAKRVQEERIRTAEAMQRQAILLEELSTPLIPITKDVIVMPLVGPLDRERTKKMCEVLLRGVVSRRARLAIIDITGVQIVDRPAVQGIVSAVECLRLVGAEVMLTGVRAQVAAALVDLDVELGSMRTSRSLQSAIVEAVRR